MRNVSLLCASILLLTLTACGNNSSNQQPPSAPQVMATSDATAIGNLDSTGPRKVDETFTNAYTDVFGGTDGSSVLNYFNTRIHYLIPDEDSVQINPPEPRYDGWTKSSQGSTNDDPNSKGDVVVGAANIGMALWFQSLIDGVQYSASFQGQNIPVTSPRVGLMLIGPGYRDQTADGISLPIEYRQSILIHEARHSDCTGGLSQADLASVRTMTSAEEFMKSFRRRECGHMHSICPEGHNFAGYPACDDMPWGAYSVELIYLMGAALNPHNTQDQQILKITVADTIDRLQFDAEAMLYGRLGRPDMSSTETISNLSAATRRRGEIGESSGSGGSRSGRHRPGATL